MKVGSNLLNEYINSNIKLQDIDLKFPIDSIYQS